MFSDISSNKTERLVTTALMMSLILVGTILLRIPIPMTQGYVHLGDAMIYLGVMILGKKNGAVAAGIGSAMGDILGGFGFWAPWTLAIKALMAYVTGALIEHSGPKHKAVIPAMAAGGLIMCTGYLLAERVMYGSWLLALPGVPWNIGQAIAGMVIALMLNSALKNIR